MVALSFQGDIREAVLEVTRCSVSLSFSPGAHPVPSGLKPPGKIHAASRSHWGNEVLLRCSIYMALKKNTQKEKKKHKVEQTVALFQ